MPRRRAKIGWADAFSRVLLAAVRLRSRVINQMDDDDDIIKYGNRR